MNGDFKLGFCPTMEGIARKIAHKTNNISFIPLGSAAEALYYLREDQIEGALIGRIAKKSEITPDIIKVNLQKDGFTLISLHKGFINKSDLPALPVVTFIPPDIVKNVIPEVKNVKLVESEEEMFNYLNDHAGLIPWSNYKDEYELLIPMEAGGKMIRFRLPVIYYRKGNEDVVLQTSKIIK